MVLARYPNIALNSTTFAFPAIYEWIPIKTGHNNTFSLSTQNDGDVAARVASWTAAPEAMVHMYASFDWDDTWAKVRVKRTPVGSPNGTEVQLTLQPAAWTSDYWRDFNPIRPSKRTEGWQSRFYIANILSELDSPGKQPPTTKSAALEP